MEVNYLDTLPCRQYRRRSLGYWLHKAHIDPSEVSILALERLSGKKWLMKYFITNSWFALVSVTTSLVFCSKNRRDSLMNKFQVIPNFWGTVGRS